MTILGKVSMKGFGAREACNHIFLEGSVINSDFNFGLVFIIFITQLTFHPRFRQLSLDEENKS